MSRKKKATPTDGADRKAGKTKKFTAKMACSLDFRVSGIATSEGVSKAQLVLKFIEQGVERYGLDEELKAVYAKIMAKTGEAA
jgi:hypothetical protein